MARAKSERSRSKSPAVDDLTQSIEQLQAFLPKLEDLGREGFPYLEGATARMELQLRECIKRAFGDKSPEFQTYRQHKLSVSSSSETKQAVNLIRSLIASLDDKKLELQGLKPAVAQQPAPPPEPARPQMTLVPPSSSAVQASQTSVTSMTLSPPVAATVHIAPHGTLHEPVPLMTPVPPTPKTAPTALAEPTKPAPAAPQPPQPIPPRTPLEPISSLFQTQETKPMPSVVEQPVPTPPAPSTRPSPAPPVQSMTQTQEVAVAHSTPTLSAQTSAGAASASAAETDHLNVSKKLCQRFHLVARQLRLRGEYRSTLNVEDESDAQDLLHALLRLQFDDIGTDEWTPGYTNGTPRTTFLLNHDRLAIVAKKTRAGLSAKELTDQVRTDIERYRARGRCTHLLCFVYDPEGRIGNPRGLERELASTGEEFTVDVVVAPK